MKRRLTGIGLLFKRDQTARVGASWVPGGPATPSKYATLEADHFDDDPKGASKGQTLVMFAVFLIGMMGMLGLATDVGFWSVAKRTVQGAADAGSFAGARQIAMSPSTAPISALSEVTTVVGTHKLGSFKVTIQRCEYIGQDWGVVGTCNQNIPVSAMGARIGTQLTVPTFFMRVLSSFGAPKSVTVYGYSKARVEVAKNTPADAPFMICGSAAWRVADKNGATTSDVKSIFASGSTTKLDQNMVGSTFRIYDVNTTDTTKPNNLFVHTGADCGSVKDKSQGKFVGLADGSGNKSKAAGSKFTYIPAASTARPGSVLTKIDGSNGCKSGSIVSGCVMIIPIATSGESGTNNQLTVSTFGAFIVTKVSDTQYNAKLLYDYIISGPGTLANNMGTGWTRDSASPVVIRLIW